jgi:TonB family protein
MKEEIGYRGKYFRAAAIPFAALFSSAAASAASQGASGQADSRAVEWFKALDAWGVTDAELNAIAAPPLAFANLASYIRSKDYPKQAVRAGQQGTTAFVLLVGKEGRVPKCHVLETSGSALLDKATCSVLVERARFVPARDAAGKNVRSVTSARITWRL